MNLKKKDGTTEIEAKPAEYDLLIGKISSYSNVEIICLSGYI